MKPTSANGVKGVLIRTLNGTYRFRVYDADHNFVGGHDLFDGQHKNSPKSG